MFPAAAAGNYWTIDDLEADPLQELEDIKGSGPDFDKLDEVTYYDFDDVVSSDRLMMFSNRASSSDVSVLNIDDFVDIMSYPEKVASVVNVYHKAQNVAGIPVPAFDELRLYPLNGLDISVYKGNSFVFFNSSSFTVPAELNNGEVTDYVGLAFPPFTETWPSTNVFSSVLDLSNFEQFSSFSLSGKLQAQMGFLVSGSLTDARFCKLNLYVDGALVRTFDIDENGFIEFASFEYDSSTVINEIRFDFEPVGDVRSNYVSQTMICSFALSRSSNFEMSLDVAEGTFRKGVLNGIGNIFQGIIELPGKIVNLLVEGLKSLFIPSEDDMTSLTGRYQQLLSERLGFIWQAYDLVSNLFTGILDALESGGAYEFSFPGISFPFNGEELVLLPETPVSLENEVMDVIRPVLGTIVCFIAVVGFINVAEGMVMALISGVSYYEFLHGKRGGSG